MNRRDFQKLTRLRIRDAQALLKTGRNASGSYYLAGYAVECAIKSCIARKTKAGDWSPSPEIARELYSHDLAKLLKQASLNQMLDSAMKTNQKLSDNWIVVKDWSEQSRYLIKSQVDALLLFNAVTDPQDGVLQWIKQYW